MNTTPDTTATDRMQTLQHNLARLLNDAACSTGESNMVMALMIATSCIEQGHGKEGFLGIMTSAYDVAVELMDAGDLYIQMQ